MVSLIEGTRHSSLRDATSVDGANSSVEKLSALKKNVIYTHWNEGKRSEYSWVHNYLRDQQEALSKLISQGSDALQDLDRELSFIAKNEGKVEGLLHPDAFQRLLEMSGSCRSEGHLTLSEGVEEWKGALSALALQEELVMKSAEEIQAWVLSRVRLSEGADLQPIAAVSEPLEEVDRTIRLVRKDYHRFKSWFSEGETKKILAALDKAARPLLSTFGRIASDAFDSQGVKGLLPYFERLQHWRCGSKTAVFVEILQKMDYKLLEIKPGLKLKDHIILSFLEGLPYQMQGLLSGEFLSDCKNESKTGVQGLPSKGTKSLWKTCANELGVRLEVVSPWDEGMTLSEEGMIVPSSAYRSGPVDGVPVSVYWNGSVSHILTPLNGKLSLSSCLSTLSRSDVEGGSYLALLALTLNALVEARATALRGAHKEKEVYLEQLKQFIQLVKGQKEGIERLRSVERMDFFRLIVDPIFGDRTDLAAKRVGTGPLARLANLESGQAGVLAEVFPGLT